MFAKIFTQIFDSSVANDWKVRHVFEDLLKLCDREGHVDMTFDAIVRRTNTPADVVVYAIGELLKPDPESRSPEKDGARLVPLDSRRPWGWKIVNYERYRNMRDQNSRRDYMRDFMRKHRAKTKPERVSKVSTVSGNKANGADEGAEGRRAANSKQEPANTSHHPSGNGEHPLAPVSTVSTELAHAEEDAEVPSAISLKGEAADGIRITSITEAKRLICQKILRQAPRIWSPEADNRLAIMCEDEGGIPLQEIEDVAWYRALPPDDKVPELRRRSAVLTETGLMRYWGDETKRAAELRKKSEGPSPKPEPPRWREFMYWKADGAEISLPHSFFRLARVQRDQYFSEFQTFEKCVPTEEETAAA